MVTFTASLHFSCKRTVSVCAPLKRRNAGTLRLRPLKLALMRTVPGPRVAAQFGKLSVQPAAALLYFQDFPAFFSPAIVSVDFRFFGLNPHRFVAALLTAVRTTGFRTASEN